MSEQEQNEHVWFVEQIAAVLSGGLDGAARARFEAHAAACASCAAELARSEEMERHMSVLFALPRAGLEDRVIESLRSARDRWPVMRIHPAVRRAAVGVAAVLMLAGLGYLADQRIEGDASHGQVASIIEQNDKPLYQHSLNDISRHSGMVNSPATAAPSSDPWVKRYVSQSQSQRLYREDFDRQATKSLNSADEKKVPYDDVLRYPSNGQDMNGLRGENSGKDRAATEKHGSDYYFDSSVANKTSFGLRGVNASGGGSGGAAANDSVTLPKDAVANGPVPGKFVDRSQIAISDGNYFKPLQLESEKQKAGEESKSEPAQAQAGYMVADVETPGAVAAPALGPAPAQTDAGKTSDSGVVGGAAPATPPPARSVQLGEPAVEPVTSPATRKVIRNGQMEFEVERFDAAFAQVSKLTTEAGGYVGTTDSEKLPNGKVKGTVTVRVPPERLDTLVLQLRGIGDLKSQKLDANDVTKQYTDLESELRADKAMEERLLAIIKEGKGQIKDLLMAEKELGIWREKIEKIVGEMRYFDNQVAMSTLQITLYERDIKTPATAKETENIDAGVEATDVEKARTDALRAIEDAKGRVIQSELKRYDAGQFGATIVADVPPDAAGALVDRLKQIGKVARLEIQRKQTSDPNADSTAASSAPVRVEKENTRLNLSLYNLANVAPRTSSAINLAADDVAKTYRAVLERVTKAGGRVVSSNLAQNKPEQTTGQVSFEVPAADADGVVSDLRSMGEVMKLAVTENPDVNNVTAAKRGFALQLIATAAVMPRETETLQVAASSVSEAREKILSAATAAGARVLVSQLNDSDRNNPIATTEVDVPRSSLAAVEKAIGAAGEVVSRSVSRSGDAENVLDTKVKLQISITPADQLPPREVTGLTIELTDVDVAMDKLQQAVAQAGGRVIESNLSKEGNGATHGTFSFDAPLEKAQSLIDEAKQQGTVRVAQSSKNLQASAGTLAKARVDLSLVTPETIVEPGTGPLATIRNGLATSVKALMWSLELVVIGLCTILPFCLVLLGAWKLVKRRPKAGIEARA